MARTIWGTRTVFSTPPASRMYMLLGTVFAMVNMSAWRVALPNRKTSSISRPKPSTRESSVPAAIRALAEMRDAVRPPPGAGSLVAGGSAVVVSGTGVLWGCRAAGLRGVLGRGGGQRRGGRGGVAGRGRRPRDLADPQGRAA